MVNGGGFWMVNGLRGMVRGRGRMDGLRWVIRSGSWFGVVGGVGRFTFVFHISDVSIFVISSISHNLDTTIGKSDFVFA